MGRQTPLMESIRDEEKFDYFLEQSKDLNLQESFGHTALYKCLESGYLDKAEKLLEKGADPSIADSFKRNAIDIAFEKGYLDLVLKYYKIKSQDLNGRVMEVFHSLAKYSDDTKGMKFILDLGLDIDAKDVFGSTPLHNAIKGGNLANVKFLVESGADLQAKDGMREVPLLVAKVNNQDEIYNYLMDKGAHFEKIQPRKEQDSLLLLLLKDLFKYVKKKVF
jgi:ankyrin repeat protein